MRADNKTDRSAAFALVSGGVSANQFGAALVTTRLRTEQLLFELLGLVDGQMARSPAIVNCLSYQSGTKMTRVRIPDSACRRRDGHALDLLQILRPEVRVVKCQTLGHSPTNAEGRRQRQMHRGGARIRQAVNGERGFVRYHSAGVGAAHLRPQRRFHVLSKRRDRVAREAIHSAGHAFDVAGVVELREAHLMQTRLARDHRTGRDRNGTAP